MTDKKTIDADALEGMDANGDGHISKAEMDMALEFKRKALEDQDSQRDAILRSGSHGHHREIRNSSSRSCGIARSGRPRCWGRNCVNRWVGRPARSPQ